MTAHLPNEVKDLKSFAELLAWAMKVWGDSSGGKLPQVRVRAKKARSTVTFTVDYTNVTCEFEELPNNAHAQWFLRLGLATKGGHAKSLDEIDSKTPGYKNAASANDWYLGFGLGDMYFGAFCDAVGLPSPVEEYLRQRYAGLPRIDGPPKRFAAISFDARAVRNAIAASSDYIAANPRVERLRPDGGVGEDDAEAQESLQGVRSVAAAQPRSAAALLGKLALGPAAFERQAELVRFQELVRALVSGSLAGKKIVQVVGEGGLGKTSLVMRYVGDFADLLFPDGVYWLDIASSSDVTTAVRSLAEQVDPSLNFKNVLEASRLLTERLATKRVLVVLNGASTLEQLSALSIVGAQGVTITTSRRPIVGISSSVFELARLEDFDATAYVESILGHHQRSDLVSRLVGTAKGLPLALRLAVSAARWTQDLERVVTMIERDEYGDHEFANVFNSLAAVLATAPSHTRQAYCSLAVLPTGVPVPLGVIDSFWSWLGVPDTGGLRMSELIESGIVTPSHDQSSITVSDLVKASLEANLDTNVSLLHGELLRLFLDGLNIEDLWELPVEHRYIWENLAHHLQGAGYPLSPVITHPGVIAKSIAVRGIYPLLRDLVTASTEPNTVAGSAAVLHKSLSQISDIFDPPTSPRAVLETLWLWSGQLGLWKDDRQFIAAGARRDLAAHGALPVVPDGHVVAVDAGASWVMAVRWISDDLVAVAGTEQHIRVIDTRTGSELLRSPNLGSSVLCLAASQGAVIAGLADGRLASWVPGDEAVVQVQGHSGAVRVIVKCPDGVSVLTAGDDAALRRWSPDWKGSDDLLRSQGISVTAMCAIGDSDRVVVGRSDGSVIVGTPESPDGSQLRWELIATLDSAICGIIDCGDGQAAVASIDGERFTIDLASGAKNPVDRSDSGLTALALAPGGLLTYGTEGGDLEIASITTGNFRRVQSNVGWCRAVAAQPVGGLIATSGDDGVLHVWNIAELMDSRLPSETFTDISMSQDGALLAAANTIGQVALFNQSSGLESRRVARPGGDTVSAIGCTTSRVALTTRLGTIDLWMSESDTWVSAARAHSDWPRVCAFDHAGTNLVTAGDDGLINIWDTSDGLSLLFSTQFVGIRLRAISWIRPNTFVIGGSGGRLWSFANDCGKWSLAGKWAVGGAAVRSLAWSQDPSTLLIGRADGSVAEHAWEASELGPEVCVVAAGPSRVRWVGYLSGRPGFLTAFADGWVSATDSYRSTHVRVATHLRSVTHTDNGVVFVGTRGLGAVVRAEPDDGPLR